MPCAWRGTVRGELRGNASGARKYPLRPNGPASLTEVVKIRGLPTPSGHDPAPLSLLRSRQSAYPLHLGLSILSFRPPTIPSDSFGALVIPQNHPAGQSLLFSSEMFSRWDRTGWRRLGGMPCVACREVVVGAVCATVHVTDNYLRWASSHRQW